MPQPTPPLVSRAFARGAAAPYIQNPIPNTTVDPGRASFELGFPPQTMTEIFAGGTPPYGQDVNGIFFMLSSHIVALQAGQPYTYNAGLATEMGGYAVGTVLGMSDGTGLWINTTAANQTDPDAGGAGWMPLFSRGLATINGLTGGVHVVTVTNYRKNVLVLSGTLTSNLQVVLPAGNIGQRSWLIVNTTNGSFTTAVRTASQSGGVIVPQGGFGAPVEVYGDGINIYPAVAPVNLPIDQNPTAGTIAQRTNSGYLFATYFNQNSPIENFGMAAVYADAGDGYHRKISLASFAAQIALSQFAGQVANAQVPQSAVTQHAAAVLANAALTGTPTAPTPAAGDNSARIATTAFVQALASIGTGQTWTVPGKNKNTNYTNGSSRPIQVLVSINITSGGGNVNVIVNGVQIASCSNGSSADNEVPFSFIVPPGASYIVNGTGSRTNVARWAELV